jgi:hypothetical protein
MAHGARELGLPLPPVLSDYVARIEARPSTEEAQRREAANAPA